MNAIATSKRQSASGGEWKPASEPSLAEAVDHTQERPSQQVIESWTEQPWAEFCSALEKPAFLLPITGFAGL